MTTFNSSSKLKVPLQTSSYNRLYRHRLHNGAISKEFLKFNLCDCYHFPRPVLRLCSPNYWCCLVWQIIVVVTDGYFSTAGNLSNTALQQAVSLLNSEGVVVFFFSLGPGSGVNLLADLRKFSCGLNSSVTYTNTEDAVRNPLWAIRPYFDYQATMRFKENVTFWTDVSESVNGQGNISTVSYPGTWIVTWFSPHSTIIE